MGPSHTPKIDIFNVALEYASLIQIHSLTQTENEFVLGWHTRGATLKMSIFRGVGGAPCHPSGGRCQIYHNIATLKPKFNFIYILIINEDILGAFGTLHV